MARQAWPGLVPWTSLLGKWLIINGAPKKSVKKWTKNGPEMDRKLVDGWELVVDSRNEVWLNRRQQKEESTLI